MRHFADRGDETLGPSHSGEDSQGKQLKGRRPDDQIGKGEVETALAHVLVPSFDPFAGQRPEGTASNQVDRLPAAEIPGHRPEHSKDAPLYLMLPAFGEALAR